jgi:hypothetical protein
MLSSYHSHRIQTELANSILSAHRNHIQFFGDLYILEGRVVHVNSPSIYGFSESLVTSLLRHKLLVLKSDLLKASTTERHSFSPAIDMFLTIDPPERNRGLLQRMHETGNTGIEFHHAFIHTATYAYLTKYVLEVVARGKSGELLKSGIR